MSAIAREEGFDAAFVVDSVGEMPITFVSAMESSNSEINSLRKNETWVLVPFVAGDPIRSRDDYGRMFTPPMIRRVG
ncbi:hypothetical protein P3T76_015506 [Phytophthora citrophthora]|uniref:Uncharacterized protein n=1 Tax=Phytophthora citrophthora TaxID=4793 RepID=A0AAD9FZM0_9STRA|nr:hypothetical protein P3T76_015506 [Phytophthora citrophthora]